MVPNSLGPNLIHSPRTSSVTARRLKPCEGFEYWQIGTTPGTVVNVCGSLIGSDIPKV